MAAKPFATSFAKATKTRGRGPHKLYFTELKCSICSSVYEDPRMIPCLHTFCKTCLEKQVRTKGTTSSGSIRCPTCSAVSPLPTGGTDDLASNFWLAHQATVSSYKDKIESGIIQPCGRCRRSSGSAVVFCCTCCLFLCSACEDDHKWTIDTSSHELLSVGKKIRNDHKVDFSAKIPRKHMMCSAHWKEELKLYCITCDRLICQECAVMEHKYHIHSYFSEVRDKEKDLLAESVRKTKGALAKLKGAIDSLEKVKREVGFTKEQVKTEIASKFGSLYHSLREREQSLCQKCEDIGLQKQNALSMQIEKIQTTQNSIAFASKIASDTINYAPAEVLSTKRLIQQRIQQQLESTDQLDFQPCESSDIMVNFDASVTELVSNFGCLSENCDPSKCTVEEGIAVPLATMGKSRMVKIVLRDERGQTVYGKVPVISKLEPKYGKSFEVVKTTTCENGYADLFLHPLADGEHQLTVKVKGAQIHGSPFKLWSRQPRNYSKISTLKKRYSSGQKIITRDVAVHYNGNVFVSCVDDGCVQVYGSNGLSILKIGSCGALESRLKKPFGVMLIEDVLYITDNESSCVKMFTVTGEYLGQFGNSESNPGLEQLCSPTGICSDGKGTYPCG